MNNSEWECEQLWEYEQEQLLAHIRNELEQIMAPTIERAHAKVAGALHTGRRRVTLKDARSIARATWWRIRALSLARDAHDRGHTPTESEKRRLKRDADMIEAVKAPD